MENKISAEFKDEPIVLSKVTLDRLFKVGEDWADVVALYLFYYRTAKWQNTKDIKAVTQYVVKGTGWTEKRVQRTKKILIENHFIRNIVRKNENNKIVGHYIHVNFFYSESDFEKFENAASHPVDFVGGGSSTDKCFSTGNLNANQTKIVNVFRTEQKNFIEKEKQLLEKIERLSKQNSELSSKLKELEKKQTPEQLSLFDQGTPISIELFETFWSLYPNRSGQQKARISWEKLCKEKTRPSWRLLRKAIQQQKKTLRWKNGFIPLPTTWLNQKRWLEDINEMNKELNTANKNSSSFGYTGSQVIYRDDVIKM